MSRINIIARQAQRENAGITNSPQNIPMPRKLERNRLKIKPPQPILTQTHQHASMIIARVSWSTPRSFE